MTKTPLKSFEIDNIVSRVQGIKATIADFADAIAADTAINDYIAQLEVLREYTDGNLELSADYMDFIAEHERDALEIARSRDLGQFTWCVNALQDIYGGFTDLTSNLPALDSLPLYNEMLDEQDGITQSDREFENWRRL